MKKVLLVAALTILATVTSKAQTTIEEYNYLTKGYKVQIESGLDMKKGYELEDITTKEKNERKVELKKLVKVNGTQKKNVAILAIYQKGSNAKEYICIPHPQSTEEIQNLYWKQLYDGSSDYSARLQLITYCLTNNCVKW